MFPIPSMIGKASQLSTSSQMMSQASTSTGVTMLHPSAPPSPRVGLLPGKLRRSSSSSGAGKGSRYSPYPSPGSNRHFVPSVPLTTRSALLSSQCYGTPLYHEYNAQRFNLEKARYHDLCNDPSSAISFERKYDVIHANLLDDLEKSMQLGRPMLTVNCSAQIAPPRQGVESSSASNSLHQAVLNLDAISDKAQQRSVVIPISGNAQSSHTLPSAAASCQAQGPLPQAHDTIPNHPPTREALSAFESWYDNHKEHPYPTGHQYAVFADVTGIAITAIKNWFVKERRKNQMAKSRKDIAAHLRATKLSKEEQQKSNDELRQEIVDIMNADRAN